MTWRIAGILVVVAGASALFLLRGRPSAPEHSEVFRQPKASVVAGKKGAETNPKLSVKASRTAEPVPADIPWLTMPLVQQADATVLRVQVEPLMWCRMGDLDAIMMDHALSDAKKVLLSLEPLLPEDASFKTLTQSLTAEQLERGFRTQFRFPTPSRPMQLGLFLCKDSSDEKRCNDKSAIDINEAITRNLDGVKNDQKYRAPDKVYFFQYLFVEGPKSFQAFQNPNIPDLAFQSVERHLAGTMEQDDALVRALDRAKFLQQTLKSLPLVAERDYVRMILPRLDTESGKCPNVKPAMGNVAGGK